MNNFNIVYHLFRYIINLWRSWDKIKHSLVCTQWILSLSISLSLSVLIHLLFSLAENRGWKRGPVSLLLSHPSVSATVPECGNFLVYIPQQHAFTLSEGMWGTNVWRISPNYDTNKSAVKYKRWVICLSNYIVGIFPFMFPHGSSFIHLLAVCWRYPSLHVNLRIPTNLSKIWTYLDLAIN